MLWAQPFQHFVLGQELLEGPPFAQHRARCLAQGRPSGASAECMSERWGPRACCRQPGLAVLSSVEWEGGTGRREQAGRDLGTCEVGCSGTLRICARKQGRGRAA